MVGKGVELVHDIWTGRVTWGGREGGREGGGGGGEREREGGRGGRERERRENVGTVGQNALLHENGNAKT